MPFPSFSSCGSNLHLAFVRFDVFQRCIFIVLILPFWYNCCFLFNVDFFFFLGGGALLVLLYYQSNQGPCL